jgi:Flp pilus assembly protein TadG
MQTTLVKNKDRKRSGSAVIELAIILPVIVLITFGTLEICDGIFLRQKIELAANEGARVAIRKNSTKADVEAAIKKNLDARGVTYGSDISSAVTITPDPRLAPTLTPLSVKVTVETNANLRLGLSLYQFMAGKKVTGEVSMFKEYGYTP